MIKRSVTIKGHRTSISMEAPFLGLPEPNRTRTSVFG